MNKIIIYTSTWCPFCTRVKQLFEKKNVPFEEIDLSEDDELREKLVAETGWRTVPMVYIGEKFIGGSDEAHQLEKEGKLDALLYSHP